MIPMIILNNLDGEPFFFITTDLSVQEIRGTISSEEKQMAEQQTPR